MISPSISPKELSVWERLRRLDFHPKTKEDFRVRTAYGGASTWRGSLAWLGLACLCACVSAGYWAYGAID
jgi:hypothetical protein